jgi:hypothetical protein
MQTFKQRINEIAIRKLLSRKFQLKKPVLNYRALNAHDQQALVMALINEDTQVHALVAMKINHALEDAYCKQIKLSEAVEGAIDFISANERLQNLDCRPGHLPEQPYKTLAQKKDFIKAVIILD